MDEPYYPDINRAALVIKLKKPFIDWLIYTSEEHDGPDNQLTSKRVETEGFDSKHVYLIPAYDNNGQYDRYVKKHSAEIFEHELNSWYTEHAFWPKDRSWKVFQAWFDYEIHTMVFDMTSGEPFEED